MDIPREKKLAPTEKQLENHKLQQESPDVKTRDFLLVTLQAAQMHSLREIMETRHRAVQVYSCCTQQADPRAQLHPKVETVETRSKEYVLYVTQESSMTAPHALSLIHI